MKRYPIPEAIDGSRDWSIVDSGHSQPACAVGSRAMRVPLGGPCKRCGTDHARIIRQHELMHAAISPQDPRTIASAEVSQDILLSTEDRRIEQRMMREGIRPSGPGLCADDLEATARVQAHDALRSAVLYAVCAPDPDASSVINATMMEEDPTLAAKVRAMVRGADTILNGGESRHPTFEDTINAARWLERMLEAADEDQDQDEDGEDGDGDEDEDPGMEDGGLNPLLGSFEDDTERDGLAGDPDWGDLRIDEPARRVTVETARNVQRWRTVESGSILRRPDRLLTDRRIFGRRLRHSGGTILVDASGSMASVTPGILAEAVTAAPAAMVARYAGNERDGVLQVVMRDGKRVPDDTLAGTVASGRNVVDGPALDWLAHQPGPRVWVSDGGVTERGPSGERWTQRAVLDAAMKCKLGGIVRVETLEDAVKVLDGRARRGRGMH